jgi:hypothetical protein
MNLSKRRLKYWIGHPASLAVAVGLIVFLILAAVIFLINTLDAYRLGILALTAASMYLLSEIAEGEAR